VGGLDGDFGVSGCTLLLLSLLVVELELCVDTSGMDNCLVEDVVRGLRDMLLGSLGRQALREIVRI
jgi:hypothetical protein